MKVPNERALSEEPILSLSSSRPLAGHLIAQNDAPPVAGRLPTTAWASGETIPDSHQIALPVGLSPGEYRLEFGLYDSLTQVRLPVVSGQPRVLITLPLTP